MKLKVTKLTGLYFIMDHLSALGAFGVVRYINSRFTYLLTCTCCIYYELLHGAAAKLMITVLTSITVIW